MLHIRFRDVMTAQARPIRRVTSGRYRYRYFWAYPFVAVSLLAAQRVVMPPAVGGGGGVKRCRDPSVRLSVCPTCKRASPRPARRLAPRPGQRRSAAIGRGRIVSPRDNFFGWRGGAVVGRRTCDQEVASSIPGRARLRNDSGQVVHTQLPRR